jgi:hypothetical protein
VRRLALILTAVVAALAAALPPAASAQGQGEVTCPGTFEVLNNDRIGRLSLAAGPYTITLVNATTLTCADASELFRQFLEDWDGRLPGGWRVDPAAALFTRGVSGEGFRVARSSGPPGPPSGRVCPSYFTVLHNDRIGSFRIAKGRYRIILLSLGSLSCARASSLFTRFLEDFDGVLPRPWFLDPTTASFMRGGRNVGFRIKPWSGPLPTPNHGGRHPASGSRCPGTFRVQHNDRIGRLRLRAGPYVVTRLAAGSPSCPGASRLLAGFLDDPGGALPRPWVLNPQTGTFTRGRGSRRGFRIKPLRGGRSAG